MNPAPLGKLEGRISEAALKKGLLLPKGMQRVKTGFIRFERARSVEAARGSSPREERQEKKKERKHVLTCTCPVCVKKRRCMKKLPVVLRYKAGIRLIEQTFEENKFIKTSKSDWNVLWVSGALRPHIYQTLTRHQKVNQFPRTYEITRKDQLCRNMRRMQEIHGQRHFNFYPTSYVLPADRLEFEAYFRRMLTSQESRVWIVKPAANACGRGIFITDNVAEIPSGGGEEGNVIVSEYISNPLLLDKRKFDLRIYAAVTSFDPLRVYMYDEGLVRLTTVEYNSDVSSLNNRFVHLTNYSVQKKNKDFIQHNKTNQEEEEDEGKASKWPLTAFRERLKAMRADVDAIFEDIEMVIVKTLISIEQQVVAAMEMHVRHSTNCFQLFGFDILIDEDFKVWLIEVNLGPSMACDSSLDFDVKSKMVTDLLTLAGVQPRDIQQDKLQQSMVSAIRNKKAVDAEALFRQVEAEQARAGGWKCLFPTPISFIYERYFVEPRPKNRALVDILAQEKSESSKSRLRKNKLCS